MNVSKLIPPTIILVQWIIVFILMKYLLLIKLMANSNMFFLPFTTFLALICGTNFLSTRKGIFFNRSLLEKKGNIFKGVTIVASCIPYVLYLFTDGLKNQKFIVIFIIGLLFSLLPILIIFFLAQWAQFSFACRIQPHSESSFKYSSGLFIQHVVLGLMIALGNGSILSWLHASEVLKIF